ncbi:MAG: glutamine--fructose-6-phosphate transaminase (isomerizing) [Acidaminococcaceae bacterium]|nr:glutamine--fructose-6-phosphate transaminase (isomerizing) [Acidaminococcaceae bacterium]
MCGIVGYIGKRKAADFLLDGLSKLEYRGYDSAGIAVVEKDGLRVEKCMGRLDALRKKLKGREPVGTVGIGHTRWATHGRPSDSNAHPHSDPTGQFVVVHNGIIENYLTLKEDMLAKGEKFSSDTDTEVAAHLFATYYHGDMEDAVHRVLRTIKGSYSLVFLCKAEPDKIICTKKDNPLVVGLGEGENYIASDIPAIINSTRKTYIMNDGEIAVVTADGVRLTDLEGKSISKKIYEVNWNAEAAEKGGFEHFMLKEIYEQPKAIRETMRGRVEDNRIVFKELDWDREFLARFNKIFIVACGTAYHAGIVGKCYIEQLAGIPVEVDIASEFRYRRPLIDENTLTVLISQSGETSDTLAALREAKRLGSHTVGVTNVVGSAVGREADQVIYTYAGPEIAVASTKAYTTQILVMLMFGIYLGNLNGRLDSVLSEDLVKGLLEVPELIHRQVEDVDQIKVFARKYGSSEDAFFLGRGLDYAVALEGALKLKEISYIHAEAYAAGELKHGTLALIVQGVPVIVLATQEDIYDKTISNIQEVKAREASVIAIGFEGDTELGKYADHVIYIPRTGKYLAPLLSVLPLQLLAYYAALTRGSDVDKPRNLAKSVTVE